MRKPETNAQYHDSDDAIYNPAQRKPETNASIMIVMMLVFALPGPAPALV